MWMAGIYPIYEVLSIFTLRRAYVYDQLLPISRDFQNNARQFTTYRYFTINSRLKLIYGHAHFA